MTEPSPENPLRRWAGETVKVEGLEALFAEWPHGVHPEVVTIRAFLNGAILG